MKNRECHENLQPQRYSNKELLELLSLYEGELQAREALLDLYQQQGTSASSHSSQLSSTAVFPASSQCSSAALFPSTSLAGGHNALLRDSQLTDSAHSPGECTPCGNALLYSAKIMQKQRNWELKIVKMFSLLKKRYTEGQHELDGRHHRMELMAQENGQYVKHLEAERDQLLQELTKCKTELAELFEQRVSVEEQFEGERERTRLMITYLMDERKRMLDEAQRHQKKAQREEKGTTTMKMAAVNASDSFDSVEQIRLLRDENVHLLSVVNSLQAEKATLNKRLDQLLLTMNNQQNNNASAEQQQQQQQLNFLMQTKQSPTRKEKQQHQHHLVGIHDNGFTVSHPSSKKQQQQQPLFPPLPTQTALSHPPPSLAPFSATTTATNSSSHSSSFSTIPPRPPTIRPSASFPLHLGSSSSSPAAVSVVPSHSIVGVEKKRPTTAPDGSNRRPNSSSRTMLIGTKSGAINQQQQLQHTHQFPVTDSDWVRKPMSPPSAVSEHHRVVVPLMGTHSANFSRSSSVRAHPPLLPPVPRTSVATIPRSPQHHRRTTLGGTTNGQRIVGGAGQEQQPQQQTRVTIARRSSSLPRRMMSGVSTTASASQQSLPLMPQHFPSPSMVHQQHHQPLQHNHHQQHSRTFIPTVVAVEQFVHHPNNDGLIGGDKYSHFL